MQRSGQRAGTPYSQKEKTEKLEEDTSYIKNFNENESMAHSLIENELGFIMGNLTEDYPLFFFDPFRLQEVAVIRQRP